MITHPTGWLTAILAVFWAYELLEATSHVAYAYNCQVKPKRIGDAFYFGTIKETLTSASHVALVLMLWQYGLMSRLDVALLLLLVAMHVVFSVSGVLEGRALAALVHGYDHGLIPFKSPPLAGSYPIAVLTKLTAHLDIGLHVYFAIRVGLLLPVPLVLLGVFALVLAWRRVVIDGILIRPEYSAIVYGCHAFALCCAASVL